MNIYMSTETLTANKPRFKVAQLTASEMSGQNIVCISACATSEEDIFEDLLGILFRRLIHPIPWELPELRLSIRRDNPCLIIFSPPLRRKEGSWEQVWNTVETRFPDVPALWLMADSNQTLDFLPATPSSVKVLDTLCGQIGLIKEVARAITKLTGIESSVEWES